MPAEQSLSRRGLRVAELAGRAARPVERARPIRSRVATSSVPTGGRNLRERLWIASQIRELDSGT
jgi:hypothetical protein